MKQHYTAVVRDFFKPMGHSVFTMRIFDGENWLYSGKQNGHGLVIYRETATKLLADAGIDVEGVVIVTDCVTVDRIKNLHQDNKY